MGHSWGERRKGGELERGREGTRFKVEERWEGVIVGERGGGLKLARERGRRVELGRGKGGGFKAGEGERERGKEFQSWGEGEGGIIDGRERGVIARAREGRGSKLERERGKEFHSWGEREGGIIDGRGEGGHSKGERGEGGLKLGRERGGRVIVGEREGGSKLGRERGERGEFKS